MFEGVVSRNSLDTDEVRSRPSCNECCLPVAFRPFPANYNETFMSKPRKWYFRSKMKFVSERIKKKHVT